MPTNDRSKIPDPATVVRQFPLTTMPAPGAMAAAPGPAKYTVLRTTQVDEYDPPVTAAEAIAGIAP